MKDSAKYAKIVEWSEEDQCYVGSAPGLILGGCHGDDEIQVFDELCRIVEEALSSTARTTSPCLLRQQDMISPIACRTSHNNRLQSDETTPRA